MHTLDPVDDILSHHGLHEPWVILPATGVANRIYATATAVLRVATDHADAVADARTESVAAPIARAAGVPVPQLLAFDDTRVLVDRPYSIWERIHGETLGLLPANPSRDRETWRAIGRQLAVLHSRVTAAPDPRGWLDRPERNLDLAKRLATVAADATIDAATAARIEKWIESLRPAVTASTARCFLHNDMHTMNVMCREEGKLLALLDWGDAGWGDPTLEFAQVPLAAVPWVMAGYESEAPGLLGECPEAQVIWDKLDYALDAADGASRQLDGIVEFIAAADARWRRAVK
jgi:aminoglycoside phosphotransferase (APT) family kinase protein